MNKVLLKKIAHYILLALVILILLSGYGITESQIVSRLTFGLLDKPTSFKLHSLTALPLIILLLIHLYFTVIAKMITKKKK